jgi:hypothetical protein
VFMGHEAIRTGNRSSSYIPGLPGWSAPTPIASVVR